MTGRLILIADAHADCRSVYAAILEHTGCHVVHAASALEAFRQLRESPVDFIVTELLPAPGADALPLAIRKNSAWSRIPMAVVTANAHPVVLESVRRLADTEVRLKPFTPSELLELLSSMAVEGRGRE